MRTLIVNTTAPLRFRKLILTATTHNISKGINVFCFWRFFRLVYKAIVTTFEKKLNF